MTKTFNVYQDDDGTVNTDPNTIGCASNDPVVGDATKGQGITYNGQGGTGSATLKAFKGAGVYEICAGPDTRWVKGYFTFL